MDAKTKRKYLTQYGHTKVDIELTGLAIDLLEQVGGCASIIKALHKKQQKHIRRLDGAAEKLGAPYGA